MDTQGFMKAQNKLNFLFKDQFGPIKCFGYALYQKRKAEHDTTMRRITGRLLDIYKTTTQADAVEQIRHELGIKTQAERWQEQDRARVRPSYSSLLTNKED